MNLGTFSLAAAFIVGLAHTLEPCEHKAIISLFVFWATKKLPKAISLIVLYGLGMALADTAEGVVISYVGMRWLDRISTPLEITAGVIAVIFGVLMLRGKELSHVGHHHGEAVAPANTKLLDWRVILGFGIVNGLPPCPLEIAVLL